MSPPLNARGRRRGSRICVPCSHPGPFTPGSAPAETVRPEHYTLTLTPDLKAATFTGVESIDVDLNEPTKRNHAQLRRDRLPVRQRQRRGKGADGPCLTRRRKEQATFTFPDTVPAGKATLSIHYTGILNNELRGFYLSKGDHRNYAVTQFESTDARRAFPSFDEPAFKATYDVSLIVDAGDTAISNSPIAPTLPAPATASTRSSSSPRPRCPLISSPFWSATSNAPPASQDGVAIRVCSTPDKVALTPYGVDVAKYVLHYYNNYFGIPYPLKKLDLIALPDFEAGAMENFGAITYRETALLIDPKTASSAPRRKWPW